MSTSQRQATVEAILEVLESRGIDYQLNGETPVSEVLIDSDKATVREMLFEQFRAGEVSVSDNFRDTKLHDDSELKKYISGLVNNWIRKYKPFNCGQAYVAKNPGSRAHVGDEQLRELKKLSAQCAEDPEAMKAITDAIVQRKAQLEAEKAKSVTVNVDALPEALRHLVKN